MSHGLTACLSLPLSTCVLAAAAGGTELSRSPAAPLVTCDPYFSIWSPADRLTDCDTVHWTGKPHRLRGRVRIDGATYRFMGDDKKTPALPQTGLRVLPTRTIYTFRGHGIHLTATWTTPALPYDIDLLARPVTYLDIKAAGTDGQSHSVAVYVDAAGELAVNTPTDAVRAQLEPMDGLTTLRVGSVGQQILAKRGDDIRIDWGYLYLAAPTDDVAAAVIDSPDAALEAFANGSLARRPTRTANGPVAGGSIVTGLALDLGAVGAAPVSRWLMFAYDDLYSIRYMKHDLRPYWRRNGWDAADLLQASAAERTALAARCRALDEELMADLTRVGGAAYAQLAALAYRQCFAAGKFVADDNGQPISFCKENHSNGCIATSDVFYPMSPQFLLFGPSVAKSFLVPFMEYASSERWSFPFAPHDLGQYPHANGQRYGGGETSEQNQMPIEESGNLLILMAAVAQMEGNVTFAERYWDRLDQWARYLRERGFDPENQLCTDDFAGHLAHNVNLSAKAICALGAFAKLCDMSGRTAEATAYRETARGFARRWVDAADDGEHFRLAFDRPGTWSQKYNLVWDRILGLGLFPDSVRAREMAHYRRVQNAYGLPLDSRKDYTKLDWVLWTATLTRDRDDFAAIVNPVVRFLNETPDRVPMTDWYWTKDARRRGFTARPVVGGVFLELLYHPEIWRKYAARDTTRAADWAPMPVPPATEPDGTEGVPDPCPMFSYFLGNGEDGLHLAWSADGLSWKPLRGGRSFLKPEVGGKLMRDPCVARGPDGVFHMVWTTGWTGRDIGYASSADLVHWSEQRALPVMEHEPTAENCWAPELTYDPREKQFVIYWSTTIPGRFPTQPDDHDHRMYCVTTRDFRTFSPARLFFEPGFNVIDGTVLSWKGRYVLVFKDERKSPVARKNLRLAFGDSGAGPWDGITEPFSPDGVWVEGPTCLVRDGRVLVYYDCYRKGRYGVLASENLATWTKLSEDLTMPPHARHGTVFLAPRETVAQLRRRDQ